MSESLLSGSATSPWAAGMGCSCLAPKLGKKSSFCKLRFLVFVRKDVSSPWVLEMGKAVVRTCRVSGCWHLAAVTKVGKDVKLASALSQEKQMQNGDDLWNFDILWRREQTGWPNIFHHCICFLFKYVEKIWDNLWSGYQFYFRSCWVFLPPIKKGVHCLCFLHEAHFFDEIEKILSQNSRYLYLSLSTNKIPLSYHVADNCY